MGSARETDHVPLGISATEQKQLFTPLVQQGVGAVKAEQQRRKASERDLLEEVHATLKRWVQECLACEEKR